MHILRTAAGWTAAAIFTVLIVGVTTAMSGWSQPHIPAGMCGIILLLWMIYTGMK